MNRLDNKAVGALVAVIVLAGLVWMTMRGQAETAAGEVVEFPAVSDLERIELMPPVDSDRPELIVVERRGSSWWLVRPVEVPVDDRYGESLERVFGEVTKTDDLAFDADEAANFGLDEASSVRISLFGDDDRRPSLELLVGRQIEIPRTGVRRTFVKQPEGDTIYRARNAFGDLVTVDIDELRDADIVSVDFDDVDRIEARIRGDGDVEFQRRHQDWEPVGEDDEASNGEVGERLVRAVTDLEGYEVFDGSPDRAGLVPPEIVVELRTGDRKRLVEFGERADADDPARYVRSSESDEIFVVSGALVESLLSDINDTMPTAETR